MVSRRPRTSIIAARLDYVARKSSLGGGTVAESPPVRFHVALATSQLATRRTSDRQLRVTRFAGGRGGIGLALPLHARRLTGPEAKLQDQDNAIFLASLSVVGVLETVAGSVERLVSIEKAECGLAEIAVSTSAGCSISTRAFTKIITTTR